MTVPKYSICTTNYNCGHALRQHLDSIYEHLNPEEFEYIVTDNKSRDNSLEILREYEKKKGNMKVLVKKSSMGKGRQISFKHSNSKTTHIMVVDTDTIYNPEIADFTRIYFEKYPEIAVQAILCGIFPRDLWVQVGGRANMNVYEDLNMWVKIWKLGKMKWYPHEMGNNIKDPATSSGMDFLDARYGKLDKIKRLVHREIDVWRNWEYIRIDADKLWKANMIDMGLGEMSNTWFHNRSRHGIYGWAKSVAKRVYIILKSV